MKNKYYGDTKIKSSKDVGDLDVELTLFEGEPVVIRKKMAKFAVTDKPLKDLTELRDKRIQPVVAEILGVLLDYDILPNSPMNELNGIIDLLVASHNANMAKTSEILWGIKEDNLRFSDIDKVLKNAEKEPKE